MIAAGTAKPNGAEPAYLTTSIKNDGRKAHRTALTEYKAMEDHASAIGDYDMSSAFKRQSTIFHKNFAVGLQCFELGLQLLEKDPSIIMSLDSSAWWIAVPSMLVDRVANGACTTRSNFNIPR
jgi:hypothetical protein